MSKRALIQPLKQILRLQLLWLIGFAWSGSMASAQNTVQPLYNMTLTGDFDGDGASDTVERRRMAGNWWEIVVRLAREPHNEIQLLRSNSPKTLQGGLEVWPPGKYHVRGAKLGPDGKLGPADEVRTFATDVIVSGRVEKVRSLKYWNGERIVGTWTFD